MTPTDSPADLKQVHGLSPEDVRGMSYNQLIGVVRETNRPPGGAESLVRIAQRLFLGRRHRVLDIGTSTGFSALELARLTGCHVTGVDINPQSLEEARARAASLGLTNVVFELQDAQRLPYADESFDFVLCGNVTSLIDDKERALGEYRRVLRRNGHVGAIPMYYVDTPPEDVVERVRAAIQVPIEVVYRERALALFDHDALEPVFTEDYRFDLVEESRVRAFAKKLCSSPHLQALGDDTREALHSTYCEHLLLFRENLAHMGFTIQILRKSHFQQDPVLFTSKRV